MTSHRLLHRVRYRECDRMGVVYHVHFLDHFEAGRTELLRSRGLTYRELEDSGILIQVVEVNVRFRRPAYYDDLLEVTTIVEKPPASRLILLNEIRRVDDTTRSEILVEGRTTLCFVERDRGRPVRAPARLVEVFGGEPGGAAS